VKRLKIIGADLGKSLAIHKCRTISRLFTHGNPGKQAGTIFPLRIVDGIFEKGYLCGALKAKRFYLVP